MFGAVVVGVGTAGFVRIRDILAPLSGSPAEKLSVKGFISRRRLDTHQGVSQISLDDALKRDDINVAFICTENETHEDNVRTFLQAGKHVCVEYPMTMKYEAAVELWDIAQEKGLVLHEEHIELLTADFKELQRAVEGRVLTEGTLHFTGGALKPGFGFPAFSGVARLTWLVELFGHMTVTAATLEEDDSKQYTKMTAKILTADNRPLTWIEERGPGLPRAKKVHFLFESGPPLTQIPGSGSGPGPGSRPGPGPGSRPGPGPGSGSGSGSVGLFMQDLVQFSSKLLGQTGPDQVQREKTRILHCLALAQKIQHCCTNTT